MNFDSYPQLCNYEIPLIMIADVPNLDILQNDSNNWTWVCGSYVSDEFSTPFNALFNFLKESANVWSGE